MTDDAEGEITHSPGWEWDPAGLSTAIAALTGDIMQAPSKVSAIKVDGVRSYKRVWDGDEVTLAARPVTVRRFEMVGAPRPGVEQPIVDIDVVVTCSSGTYIRALARDLGEALQSAGHLTALRRTAIGAVQVQECDRLGEQAPPVVGAAQVLSRLMTSVVVSADQAVDLGYGRAISVSGRGLRAAIDGRGQLVAVLRCQEGMAKVEVNLGGQSASRRAGDPD